jgi:hypothetical protein
MLKSSFCIRALCRLGLVAAFLTISTGAVSAQSTGGIKGKVRNMAGDSIRGATVTARQNSQDLRSARSNDKGEFELTGLTAGTYNIVFDAKGYSTGIKYSVDVKSGKTVDLGDRLIMQVDRGTQVIVKGSVFFKDGTTVTAAKVLVEEVGSDNSTRKIGTVMTNIFGEFEFRRPEGAAKYRMTAIYRDAKASKELEVDSAAIYRLAISLDITRQQK